jgi:hypothetical protein
MRRQFFGNQGKIKTNVLLVFSSWIAYDVWLPWLDWECRAAMPVSVLLSAGEVEVARGRSVLAGARADVAAQHKASPTGGRDRPRRCISPVFATTLRCNRTPAFHGSSRPGARPVCRRPGAKRKRAPGESTFFNLFPKACPHECWLAPPSEIELLRRFDLNPSGSSAGPSRLRSHSSACYVRRIYPNKKGYREVRI